MARHDGDLRSAGAEPLDVEEVLALLDSAAPALPQARENARACYFSASDGWRDAQKQLRGAFASELGPLNTGKKE